MARLFPGSTATDNIRVTQQAKINGLTTLTVSVWMRAIALDVTPRRIFDKYDNTAGHGLFRLRINSTNIFFTASRWSTTVGGWSFPFPTTGVWHHVCVTYDYGSTANNPIAYLDGVSQTVTLSTTPVGSLGTDTIDLFIGNDATGALTSCFNGSLAEAAIWNTPLSQAQVSLLAAGADPRLIAPANLNWYLPLCGVSSPEPDYSGNRNNGVVTGTSLSAHPPVSSVCNIGSPFASEEAGVGFCSSNKDSAITVW